MFDVKADLPAIGFEPGKVTGNMSRVDEKMNKNFKMADDVDIEINEVEGGYVIYQAEKDRIHYLNQSAVLVMESCTGANSVDEIVEIVRQAFELAESPEQEIKDCLDSLLKEGLIRSG